LPFTHSRSSSSPRPPTPSVRLSLPLQLELATALAAVLLLLAVAFSLRRKARPVYLVDFNVFRAPDRMKMSREAFMGCSRKAAAFDAKALVFQDKMVMKGGLGDHTYLPDAMHASPPVPSMALAREEAEIVMFTAVRDALAAANLRATDVDCVVVNCSLFNPTPSLAAMLVNHFKMRSDVVSYSLGDLDRAGEGAAANVQELDVSGGVDGEEFFFLPLSGFFFSISLFPVFLPLSFFLSHTPLSLALFFSPPKNKNITNLRRTSP
jgi:FAE1/Type III polyketide synthase-like protein